MCFERKFTNYFIKTKILTVFIDEDSLPVVAFMVRTSLRQEIFIRMVKKSDAALDLPPRGSSSRIFCRLFSPQAMPLLPLELKA